MTDILEHKYLKNTHATYPTGSLKGFVRTFQDWARAGGQRDSLYGNYGAEAAKAADDLIPQPGWRFSTLDLSTITPDNIDQQLSPHSFNNEHRHHSHLDQVADMTSTQAQEDAFNSYHASEPSSPYLTDSDLEPGHFPQAHENQTHHQEAKTGKQVLRGQKSFTPLFNPKIDPDSKYKYPGLNPAQSQSDLPFRNADEEASATTKTSTQIEAMATTKSGDIELADPSTLKAKRHHKAAHDIDMQWQFPPKSTEEDTPPTTVGDGLGGRPNESVSGGDSPRDEIEGDSRSAQYKAPSVADWAPATHQPLHQDSDFNTYHDDPPIEDAEDDQSRGARMTLDLDALMGDLGPNTAGPSAYMAPQSTTTSQQSNVRDYSPTNDTDTAAPPPPPAPAPSSSEHGTPTSRPLLEPQPPSLEAMRSGAPAEVVLAEALRLIDENQQQLAGVFDFLDAEEAALEDADDDDDEEDNDDSNY